MADEMRFYMSSAGDVRDLPIATFTARYGNFVDILNEQRKFLAAIHGVKMK